MRPRLANQWSNRTRLAVAVALMPLFLYPFALGYALTWLRVPSWIGFELSRDMALVAFGMSAWLLFRSIGARWFFATVTVLLAAAWMQATIIWRDAEYWRLVDGYKQATALAKTLPRGSNGSGWAIDIALPNNTSVHLVARDHMDTARLRYSDEPDPRDVFRYEDYTNVEDIRRNGTTIYVLRDIILFRAEFRLTAYDLNQRSVIADRRVDRTNLQ